MQVNKRKINKLKDQKTRQPKGKNFMAFAEGLILTTLCHSHRSEEYPKKDSVARTSLPSEFSSSIALHLSPSESTFSSSSPFLWIFG